VSLDDLKAWRAANPAGVRAANRRSQSAHRARQRAAKAKAKAAADYWPPVCPANRSRAAAVARWAAAELRVPGGHPNAGQPFRLAGFQMDLLRAIYAPGNKRVGLSIARKNAKSATIAIVLLAALCGPTRGRDWRAIVCSLTAALAKELQAQMAAIAGAARRPLPVQLRKTPYPGAFESDCGRVDFLAADKSTGHAVGADLVLFDELGLLDESRRALVDALLSCVSARDGQFVGISIRGHSPLFAEIEAEAEKGLAWWREYAAPPGCRPDDPGAWKAANPGLASGIKSQAYMRRRAAQALAVPAQLPNFLAHDLNLPGDPDREGLVALSAWQAIERLDCPALEGRIVLGIDLGQSVSMSAAVAVSLDTGAIRAWGAFAAQPGLRQRADADGVGAIYARIREAGQLGLMPGRVVKPADFVAEALRRLVPAGCNLVAVGVDRYRRAEAEQALRSVSSEIVFRGTGAHARADGSADVRAAQRLIQTRALSAESPDELIRFGLAQTVLRFDGGGNPALDKSRSKARIDPISALVIACGLYEARKDKPGLVIGRSPEDIRDGWEP